MYNILFYGDSNTWGFNPETGRRYPYEVRWTTICENILGEGYNCIPAGLNGRTTAFDDPEKPLRNGLDGIDIELQTHKPLDLVVIMLGTNDLKYTDAAGSAVGMENLTKKVITANERYNYSSPVFLKFEKEANPEKYPILILSPVHLNEHVGEINSDIKESRQLSNYYEQISSEYKTFFMDIAQYAEPSIADGVHLGITGHAIMGRIVADKISRLRNRNECAE